MARMKDNYGRFVAKDYQKFVLADIESVKFSKPIEPVKNIPYNLQTHNWQLCCGSAVLAGFTLPYNFNINKQLGARELGFTHLEYIEHNVKTAVRDFGTRKGQLFAIINHKQKEDGWGEEFIKNGFKLLSAVCNPVHNNQSRIYTYALYKGDRPQVAGEVENIE